MKPDPFRQARERDGILVCPFQGENVPMVLDYRDLRQVTQDWNTFSSDAPFRVPIPSEEEDRTVRQLPIERDPPLHTDYRKLVEKWFKRPRLPEYQERLRQLVDDLLDQAVQQQTVEAVSDIALTLQSRALTVLLNMPESEADLWISWGTHVFHSADGVNNGAELEAYLNRQFDRAETEGGDDFFAVLSACEFDGRSLTREEKLGFGNLAFAGGRDTVINSITEVLAFLAREPVEWERLRQEPKLRTPAAEELFRWISPITHIGRVCPHGAEIRGHDVPPNGRVSLNWAAANRDPGIFDQPDEIRIDRMPNPHVAFGSGPHACLGATHARALIRCLLDGLCDRALSLEVLEETPRVEQEGSYQRENGHNRLLLQVGSSDSMVQD